MKHISVTDTTIRQAGKAAGYTLSFREKIELAKLLDRLGVSVIELHAVENPKIDSLLIKSVASAVKESAVCVPVALDPASVSLVWAALKEAKHPRIQHGNQLPDRHVGSTPYVLPSASYTPLRWFRVESVCRLSFMLKVASLSAASSVSRNEA